MRTPPGQLTSTPAIKDHLYYAAQARERTCLPKYRTSSSVCSRWQGIRGGRYLSLALATERQKRGKARSPVLIPPGPVCLQPSNQGQLYCASLTKGRLSLLSCLGASTMPRKMGSALRSPQISTWLQVAVQTIDICWTLEVIEPHCCRTVDPVMAFCGSTGQDFTTAPTGTAGHSLKLFLTTFDCRSNPLHCAHIFLHLPLLQLSTTSLFSSVAPRHLGVWHHLRSVMRCLCTGQGSS